jgi:glycopeptide antibiotics resistance protein
MRAAAVAVGVVYLAALLALTFLPFGAQGQPGSLDLRLVPLQTIRGALRLGPGSYEYGVLIGNLLAFVPVGLLVPILTRTRSVVLAIGAGFLLSVLIELGQLAISVALGYAYRSADVDDVLVNTLGAAVGYAIFYSVDTLASWLDETGR